MKHIRRVTVAKATAWDSISTFFEDLWKDITKFFGKGDSDS